MAPQAENKTKFNWQRDGGMETIKNILDQAEIAKSVGDHELAIRLFGRVATRAPANSHARNAIGKLRKARFLPKTLTQQEVDQAANLFHVGKVQEAMDTFGALLTIEPRNSSLLNMMGLCQLNSGACSEAAGSFKQALKHEPKNIDAMSNLGSAYLGLDRLDQAVATFQKAISINPNHAETHHNLALVYMGMNRPDDALISVENSLAVAGLHPIPAATKASLLLDLGRQDEAIDFLRLCIQKFPNDAALALELGNTLVTKGEISEAQKLFEPIILKGKEIWASNSRLSYDFARACRSFSKSRKFTREDPLLEKIVEFSNFLPEDEEAAMHADFAAAKALEDIGEYQEAFLHLAKGNANKRKRVNPYSTEQRKSEVNKIIEDFEAMRDKHSSERAVLKPQPIFVLGMPRSGTTLTEQILSSHSLVYGAGELAFIDSFAKRDDIRLRELDQSDKEKFATDYIESVRSLSKGEPYFTDKMPANFNWIGLIKSAFPDAKVIQLARDPRDNCLSIYKNLFGHNGLQFAYNLEELAEYYLTFKKLMEYWHKAFPGEIYTCSYETLTSDQEGETRRLLDYCGLPWEDGVLEFHKNKRDIRTASVVQVRQKMYKSSVASWKRYENELAPLIKILDNAGVLPN